MHKYLQNAKLFAQKKEMGVVWFTFKEKINMYFQYNLDIIIIKNKVTSVIQKTFLLIFKVIESHNS
jgi:hypothetical protein